MATGSSRFLARGLAHPTLFGKEVELAAAAAVEGAAASICVGRAAITKPNPNSVIHGIEHLLIPVGQLEHLLLDEEMIW
jgi:hypothetical protein